jgi:hypothetical protein
MMNDLEYYFYNNESRIIHKWDHYFNIYERYFRKYVGGDVNVLEIGVQNGGSAEMWRRYFGDKCKIYGIDIDDRCKQFENDWMTVYIGDQADTNFLSYVKESCPRFDIIIDDGGHRTEQMVTSFEQLFDHLKFGGTYLIEDLHANYLSQFGGDIGTENSFNNYVRKLCDRYHLHSFNCVSDNIIKNIECIHTHESVVVIEKCLDRKVSRSLVTGKMINILIP